MEQNNNKADWLKAGLVSPTNTIEDFKQEGLSPENVQVLPSDKYKQKDFIKDSFTNSKGEFDEDAFTKYYNQQVETYNTFAKDEHDDKLLKSDYYSEYDRFAPKDAKRGETMGFTVTKLNNPYGNVMGFDAMNSTSVTNRSDREIGQTQRVWNSKLQKYEDYTPNQLGFWGSLFNKESLVVAQWDEDGEHYDEFSERYVKHKKGEYRKNEFGKTFYETLGDRSAAGRTQLSSFNVLTEDGSFADRFNFLDNDGLEKSLGGTVMQTASKVAPFLIKGVSKVWTPLTVGASLLTEIIPALAKTGTGILFGEDASNSDVVKAANYMSSLGGRLAFTHSDHAMQSTFNAENIFSMAGDVFGQLAQQKHIAQIPGRLGMRSARLKTIALAEEANLDKKDIEALKNLHLASADKRPQILRSLLTHTKEGAGILKEWDTMAEKGGKALGATYMTAISAAGIFDEAKAAGLDDRDAAAMSIGGMAALGWIQSTDLGHFALHQIGLDEIGSYIKGTIKKEGKAIFESIAKKAGSGAAKETAEEATKKAWYTSLFNKGKQLMTKVSKPMEHLNDKGFLPYGSIVNEALEEVSEEFAQDVTKLLYNGASKLGMTSTDNAEGYDFTADDVISRYAMSAFGGAIGGGISGFQNALAGHVYSSLPQGTTKTIISAVMNGHADALRTELTKQYKKGLLPGNENLTPKVVGTDSSGEPIYEPTNSDNALSQSEAIYKTMMQEIDFIEATVRRHTGDKDLDMAPIFKTREQTMINLKHNTAIRDDIAEKVSQILKIEADIAKIQGGIKDASDPETKANQDKITALKVKLKPLEDELANILNGNNMEHYVGHAIWHMNKYMSSAYGVKTMNDLAESVYSKPMTQLNPEERKDIEDQYANYVKYDKRKASLVGYEKFLKDTKHINDRLNELAKYANQRIATLDGGRIVTSNVEVDDEGTTTKLSGVYNMLANMRQDMDEAIQNGTFRALQTATDVPIQYVEEGFRNEVEAFKAYFDLLRGDSYINPELANFLNKFLDKRLKPIYYKDGKDIVDENTILQAIVNEVGNNFNDGVILDLFGETGEVGESLIRHLLITNKNALTYSKFTDAVESVSKGDFIKDDDTLAGSIGVLSGGEVVSLKTAVENNYRDDSGRVFDEEYKKELLDKVRSSFNDISAKINDAYTTGLGRTLTDSEEEVSAQVNELLDSAKQLSELVKERSITPFHDLMKELAKVDGVDGMDDIFDTIIRQYDTLSRDGIEQFIMSSQIDVDHLKYALNVIGRTRAAMLATVTDEKIRDRDDTILGYNNSINNVSIRGENWQELPELTSEQGVALTNELEVLEQRIGFLLELSTFNINGSVRESKVLGARALTLYINSLSPESENFNILKKIGLDTTALEAAFDEAEQFNQNVVSITSTDDNSVPFDSSDSALDKLRMETDRITQEVYKLFNDDSLTVDQRNALFEQALDAIDPSTLNVSQSENITQRTKSLSRVQELMYLFQSATIDTKQFYKDMAGDLNADSNNLTESSVTPFLNQEFVVKQLYFSIMSKYKEGIDVYRKLAEKVLPVTNASDENRNPQFMNREDLPSLYSAIFLDGIPGSGKTSTAINTLSKMIANYDLTIATFAPYSEQVSNLNSSLDYKDNLLNPEGGVIDSLFEAILGKELYETVKQDLQNINPDEDVDTSTIRTNKERFDKRVSETGSYENNYRADVANTENDKVADFLQNFTRISINGKVPNVIAIDEATHIPISLLDLLNRAVDLHNSNPENTEKVSLVFLGDTEQNGAEIAYKREGSDERISSPSSIVFTNVLSTPKLTQTFRGSFSTIRDNISSIRAFKNTILSTWANPDTRTKTVSNELNLKYAITEEEGLIGFKSTNTFDESDLKAVFDHATDKVAIIVDDVNSELISKVKSLGYTEDQYQIFTPNNVQGLERDYVLVDLTPPLTYDLNYDNVLSFVSEINSVYTALSRAKRGAIITNSSTTSAIKLNSDSNGVSPFKIELNKNNLSKYKDFTVDSIKKSASQLEDLPQHFSKDSKPVIVEKPEVQELENTELLLKAGVGVIEEEEASTDPTNKGEVVTDGSGNKVPVTEILNQIANEPTPEEEASGIKPTNTKNPMITYSYGEQLGFLVQPNGHVRFNTKTGKLFINEGSSDSDGLLIAKRVLGVGIDAASLRDNFKVIRNTLNTIRVAWLNKINGNKEGFDDILNKSSVSSLIGKLSELKLDSWETHILVKEYDDYDVRNPKSLTVSSSHNSMSKNEGSQTAYLVLVNPKNKNEYITLTALPSGNPDVIGDALSKSLNDLFIHKKAKHGDKSLVLYKYNATASIASNVELQPITAAERKYNLVPTTLNELRSENPHLVISEPFVISGPLFTTNEASEIDSYIASMSSTVATTTKGIRGLPFVFVSTDKRLSNNTNTMLTAFKKSIKNTAKAGKYTPGNVRMIGLRPKTRSFSEWFDWNAKLGLRFNSGDVGSREELASAENNYVVAKMLARFTYMMHQYTAYKKANAKDGVKRNKPNFLPTELTNVPGFDLDVFMGKIQNLLNVAVPAAMGMTHAEYVSKLTDVKLSEAVANNVDLKDYIANNSELITKVQSQYYNGEQGANHKATEHVITKQLLEFINAKGETKVELTPDAKDNVDPDGLKLTKEERSGLINMVVALRIAINGGKVSVGEGGSKRVYGLFNNLTERNNFLKQLDLILTGNKSNFNVLFPNGINSNIAHRRMTDSNRYQGVAPFAMDLNDGAPLELAINTKVHMPKVWIDFNGISTDGTHVIGSEETSEEEPPLPPSPLPPAPAKVDTSDDLDEADLEIYHLSYEGGIEDVKNHPLAKGKSIPSISREEFVNAIKQLRRNDSSLSVQDAASQVLNIKLKEAVDTLNSSIPAGGSLRQVNPIKGDKLNLLNNAKVITGVTYDGNGKIVEQSINPAESLMANNVTPFLEALAKDSPDLASIINEGLSKDGGVTVEVDKDLNGTISINHSGNSTIFGTFVYELDETALANGEARLKETPKVVRGNVPTETVSEFEKYNNDMKDKLKDQEGAVEVWNEFVDMLELAVKHNFTNIGSIEHVRDLNKAYINASLLLRDDEEALKSLQAFYRDYIDVNKC